MLTLTNGRWTMRGKPYSALSDNERDMFNAELHAMRSGWDYPENEYHLLNPFAWTV